MVEAGEVGVVLVVLVAGRERRAGLWWFCIGAGVATAGVVGLTEWRFRAFGSESTGLRWCGSWWWQRLMADLGGRPECCWDDVVWTWSRERLRQRRRLGERKGDDCRCTVPIGLLLRTRDSVSGELDTEFGKI
ncbi:putative leucine-rich repeat extensin-like protein 7 [Iris pallida]|uniref:Leucine-rich repeat extensin-like protein 7 n=1 Tax=Iris pallida TaxID=29817 RepID=A0AAX6H6Q3_IRIPA|nr:putative leucine-rich repeat extensin-like protein 7 [Iris pallida]KAJ6836679.1 putative leucine-rich repeat extensin-like protein 7 [Iris pallida]